MKRKTSLEIVRKELPNLDVLRLKGSLTFGEPDLIFRTEVDRTINRGKCRLVVDLEDLKTIDAIGCGTLLAAEKELRTLGGGLALVHLASDRFDPVQVERIESVLEPFDIEQEAIESFFSHHRVKHYDILDVIRSHQLDQKAFEAER